MLKICLAFWKFEPQYAYKRYAYKKKTFMHNLWVFCYYFQKSLFAENYFLIAAMNLTTRGPLYTCLVLIMFISGMNIN